MNPEIEIQKLLNENGAKLLRNNKHQVWGLPNGREFTCANTPSDRRAAANALSDLRKVLEISDPNRGQPGERRARKAKAGRYMSTPTSCINSSMHDQLSKVGLVEDMLNEQIAALKAELAESRVTSKKYHSHLERCWHHYLVTRYRCVIEWLHGLQNKVFRRNSI